MTGHRIVIADDEPHVLSALAQLLESAGHIMVGKAGTGEEAISLCQSLRPDVVLLDVHMPGMDGLEAAKRIMSSHPLPVVICTAYCDDDLMNMAANVGVYAYVVKPCRLSDLLPAINVAISRFEESRLLRGEIETLKQALEDRKCIEQAKGIVMRTRQLTEEQAHRFLQQESQRQSRLLRELAEAIVLADRTFSSKCYDERGSAGEAG
ncbi:MAG TPA: response regulator [Armatimonadota bacterium]|nr:response regulator [Armatimonadota bacterium]